MSEKAQRLALMKDPTAEIHKNYAYNHKGQLVVDGYAFIRSVIKGAVNTSIQWRCADTKKHKCAARVKTLGKKLQPINLVHTHQPRKQKQLSAIVWQDDVKLED